MASRAFEVPEVQELPLFAEGVRLSIPIIAGLVCPTADISGLADIGNCDDSGSTDKEGSLIAGVTWAIALEAAAVAGIYGLWNLCHLLQ